MHVLIYKYCNPKKLFFLIFFYFLENFDFKPLKMFYKQGCLYCTMIQMVYLQDIKLIQVTVIYTSRYLRIKQIQHARVWLIIFFIRENLIKTFNVLIFAKKIINTTRLIEISNFQNIIRIYNLCMSLNNLEKHSASIQLKSSIC